MSKQKIYREENGEIALKRIAARPEIFDDEDKWTRLVAANRDDYRFDEKKLKVGQLLLIPRGAAWGESKPRKIPNISTQSIPEGMVNDSCRRVSDGK